MHVINIGAKFSLCLVHSIVGCNYFWRQRHTRILESPEITVPRFAGNRRPRANRSRRFFIRKKGVNSKQKVFPAMGSHAPGAYHLMTSFAVEQSATSMSGRANANASSFNQIPSMRHQPWTLEQDHVLSPILRELIIHTPASEFQEHLWKSRLSFARGSHCIAGLKMKSCCQSCL
jgi:hypothetical protein